LFGQQSVTDGDEVPIENLIGELVNSMHEWHPAGIFYND